MMPQLVERDPRDQRVADRHASIPQEVLLEVLPTVCADSEPTAPDAAEQGSLW